MGKQVWSNRTHNEQSISINISNCRLCNKKIKVKHELGRWYALTCKCVSDGKSTITYNKLTTLTDEYNAEKIIQEIYKRRTKKFFTKIEKWVDEGYSVDEAKEKVSIEQKRRSMIAAELRRSKPNIAPSQQIKNIYMI
jgi:hypothetical protein